MSVYDYIYMNMVTMIVMNVCVNVRAGFRQITLIKDTVDTVLLMMVCPFVQRPWFGQSLYSLKANAPKTHFLCVYHYALFVKHHAAIL